MDLESELSRWPTTGRFLAGRLRHAMTEEERDIIEDSIHEVATIEKPTRILEHGAVYHRSTMLIEGFVVRTIDGPENRHAVSFHVPGDFVDLHCFALKRLDHNIDTIGPAKVGYVSHQRLRKIMEERPQLARLLWYSTLLDAAMHREWVMKLEQLTTARRIAHIFAEIWHRLQMVGLAQENGFDTPLTQSELGEMCGATTIHVNRALRELREEGIAEFVRGRVEFSDRKRLEAFGLFEPDYLYGEGTNYLREGYSQERALSA
ncbi:Crp/Fnr family transcriptional regulator [Erythrobacter sp. SCSIO 43205]|nr:Crp/Fnr family transcriptional regulator [Erythrobacter sp. SCSIO 43205]